MSVVLPPNFKSGAQLPTMGMDKPVKQVQGTLSNPNYTLGVANILPNNQPYYVPGSGRSTTYAPGLIPDLNAPAEIPTNILKLGQEHLAKWQESQQPNQAMPSASPVISPPAPLPQLGQSNVTPPQSNIGIPTWAQNGTGNKSMDMWDQFSRMNAANNGVVTKPPQTGWY